MAGVSYDTAGNQTKYDGMTLEYDAEGRNTKARENNADYVTFAYDGEGRRVKKTSGGVTTYYIYNALGQMAAEYSNGASAAGTSYMFTDMLGSVRTITNASGAVTECYDYLPFGRILSASDNGRSAAGCHPPAPDTNIASSVDEKFTGQKRDETGLDYFGARYYSSPLGRFTSPDPLMASGRTGNPQTWNRYAYTLNNPLRFIDPDGMEVPDECVKDLKCKIEVRINVIYDKNAFGKEGISDAQKNKFEAEQLEKAKKDFGVSNITLKVNYSEGEYDRACNSFSEFNIDSLNVVATSSIPKDYIGASGLEKGTKIPYIMVNVDNANVMNTLFTANTIEHEMSHHFRGDVDQHRTFFNNLLYDSIINIGFYYQSHHDIPMPYVREGLAPRRYAVPANPEVNKPRKE